ARPRSVTPRAPGAPSPASRPTPAGTVAHSSPSPPSLPPPVRLERLAFELVSRDGEDAVRIVVRDVDHPAVSPRVRLPQRASWLLFAGVAEIPFTSATVTPCP